MLRIYTKVDTCDYAGMFFIHMIGAHLSLKAVT
jgi:hypothetical protein